MVDALLCNHWDRPIPIHPAARRAEFVEVLEALGYSLEPAPVRFDAPACAAFTCPRVSDRG